MHENPATAWSEGWGNFFQSPVRCSAGYSSCDHYLDSNSFGGWDLNLETGFDDAGTGSTDVEGAVTTALWDIYDASDDSGDTMSAGFAPIWTVFDAGTGGDTIGIFRPITSTPATSPDIRNSRPSCRKTTSYMFATRIPLWTKSAQTRSTCSA